MKRTLWMLGIVLYSLSAKSGVSYAQTSDPLLSWKRLSVAAGVEKEVLLSSSVANESWFAVLPIAYNVLSPPTGKSGLRVSLIARPSQSFETSFRTELFVGARITLWRGSVQ